MNELEESISIYAFRYCFGRATYAVDDCINHLRQKWTSLSFKTKYCILTDIIDGVEDYKCGMTMDCDKWKAFVIIFFFKLTDDQQARVISGTKHKDYPAWLIPLKDDIYNG